MMRFWLVWSLQIYFDCRCAYWCCIEGGGWVQTILDHLIAFALMDDFLAYIGGFNGATYTRGLYLGLSYILVERNHTQADSGLYLLMNSTASLKHSCPISFPNIVKCPYLLTSWRRFLNYRSGKKNLSFRSNCNITITNRIDASEHKQFAQEKERWLTTCIQSTTIHCGSEDICSQLICTVYIIDSLCLLVMCWHFSAAGRDSS